MLLSVALSLSTYSEVVPLLPAMPPQEAVGAVKLYRLDATCLSVLNMCSNSVCELPFGMNKVCIYCI